MTIRHIFYAIILGFVLLTSIVHAVPTGGAAGAITSNSFNVSVTGSDGGDTWIAWGQLSKSYPWGSGYQTGDGTIMVYGAPIIGGSKIYYVACDSTGCDPTERSLSIPAITPMPTTTFGDAFKILSSHHFAITSILPQISTGYTASGMPMLVFWGIVWMSIFFGFWFRTKSVRLAFIVGLLLAEVLVTPLPSTGVNALGFSLPIVFQVVAQGLMAVALAGILISWIRK
jgi:hypothetical protein